MKNLYSISFIFILLIINTGSVPDDNDCRREKFSTAEPGTCFHPDAYRLLKFIKKAKEDTVLVYRFKRFIDFVEPRVHHTVDTLIESPEYAIPLRIYYPRRNISSEPTPLIFYIHGGAFMYGSIEEYDMLAKKIVKTTNCIVTSVEYRLAPDHPYPAAVKDSYNALVWVSENAENLGGNKNNIFVMGSSAGGNLATVMTLKSHDAGIPKIAGQILYYPATTFRETEFPSRMLFFKDTSRYYFLTENIVRRSKTNYMASYMNEDDPYLSPLEAELSSELPPALIFTAQCDPLRDEGNAYAEKLEKAGVEAEAIEYEGMIHGFVSFYSFLRDGKKSLRRTKEFVNYYSGDS